MIGKKHYLVCGRRNAIGKTFILNITLFLFFSILAILFSPCYSFAQHTYELDKTTRFEKMGAEEGLSTGYVYCIHQDKYDFIWIGTQNGLNLYDGYEVKVFRANPNDPHSLSDNWIRSIFEEADGTMWFCTDIGINKYNRANQTFNNYIPDTLNLQNDINFTTRIIQDGDFLWVGGGSLLRFKKQTGEFISFGKNTTNPAKGINGTYLTDGFIDGEGVLWAGTNGPEDGSVLNRFNKETESFTHFINDPSNPESFIGKEILSMIEDSEGTIWIATSGGGLLEIIDKLEGKFRQYVHDDNDTNSIIHNYLQKIFEDSKGNIWVGGVKGFSLLNKITGQFINYHVPNRIDFSNRSNVIYDISEGANGELFLSSRGGLFRFNPSTRILSHFLNDPENLNGISGNLIYQVITDRTNQTWIIAPNSRINRINQFSNAFKRIHKKPNVKNSLSDNFTSRFYIDSKNNLWIGSFGGGLNRTTNNVSKVFDNFEHFSFDAADPGSISGNRIMPIYEDKDQILWFGTFWGLNSYDYTTGRFTRFQHDPDDSTTISSNMVESIFEDSNGTFWVGTRDGLNIMDRETGKFIRILPDDNDSTSIESGNIQVIFEDSFGELWFGGSSLEKLNRKDTSFMPGFPESTGDQDVILRDVLKIVEDNSSNLWISTFQDGLYRFNREESTFNTFTTQQGLPSNSIHAIEIDNSGYIWVSTTHGLSRINPHDYSIRNFDMSDGLVSLEFIGNSSYKDDEGWLYFGSRDGFNIFHPDSIKENKFIPPVYITSLIVAGQQKYFDKPLYEMASIELQYYENDFSIDFVTLNYINSQKNQYAYMLEGYDEEWNYVGRRRTAFYTNLSPGKYTFRVKGSNNDAYWNEEGASLAVIIHPPFWKTWWAYVMYALAFIYLVYLIRRNEIRKLKLRQDLELKQVQTEKLAELDIEKNKFFSNISHEFRTPLTLILGPLDRFIAKLKSEDQKQEINLVRRNALRLQILINQLLSLSKLESGKMKLKARPEDIVKLTRLFLQSFHSMAEHRGISLEFKSNADKYIVYIDALKFEKVINNLLSNAFKFTNDGGRVEVSVDKLPTTDCQLPTSDCIQIKISDTGIGISKEELPHVFDRFYQVDEQQMKTKLGTGIGLALTKELIELHYGTITANSEYTKGTIFTISMPKGKEHLLEDEIVESAKEGSDTDDDLLNDEYLFVSDAMPKTEFKTKEPGDKDVPLLLIVEDNEDMRVYIKSYLIDTYNVIEAANGKEGIGKAIEHIPDLIVSDLMMPELDGNEMCTQLKTDERTSHIPIILLTAKASRESKLEGLETGADDFLTKPFDAEELLIRIKNLIEQRKKLSLLISQYIGDNSQTRLIQKSSGKMITKVDELFIEKVTAVVQEHMSSQELDVEMLAREMAMSRMQLHRKLKSLTDHSASDLIRNIRLMKAAELLKEGELNVTQVSYEIGILSLSNFAKTFKEKYGVTPSEYG